MNSINMKNSLVIGGLLTAMVVNGSETPQGWFAAGQRPRDYEMSTDRSTVHGGSASASVKCIAPKAEGFGTLMQTFAADAYRGKRVRFSGYVRSAKVADWAGLWMRVDGAAGGANGPEALAFDNMQKRPIKGTTDWTQYEIVLDVPERAQEIAYGILLSHTGQVWMDDLKVEVVGTDVTTTAVSLSPKQEPSAAPVNLDFEE
jgi:hypothetical protein